jgi:hypothetical protein
MRPTASSPKRSKAALAVAGAALMFSGAMHAQEVSADDARPRYLPSAMHVQAGVSENSYSAALGARWEWGWRHATRMGTLTGYWEGTAGAWSSKHSEDGQDWSFHLGITPVLRLYPVNMAPGWFVEGGIGANVIAPTYQAGGKRFSTAFNFGTHLGVGKRFGESRRSELTLRVQHFSNAGIKHPNPGENFVQLRYAYYF